MQSEARKLKRSQRTGTQPRIFCAGPLFNRAEQVEMAEIAAVLDEAGFRTFLPQRDGFVLPEACRDLVRSGYGVAEASRMAQLAIFWLDVFEVVQGCQGLVANLNGRVPDEGAVVQAAMAWMAGKVLVLYKSDSRTLVQGNDSPLVAGLGQFVAVSTIPEIAYAFAQIFRKRASEQGGPLPQAVRAAVECGRRLSAALATARSPEGITSVLIAATRSALAKPTR